MLAAPFGKMIILRWAFCLVLIVFILWFALIYNQTGTASSTAGFLVVFFIAVAFVGARPLTDLLTIENKIVYCITDKRAIIAHLVLPIPKPFETCYTVSSNRWKPLIVFYRFREICRFGGCVVNPPATVDEKRSYTMSRIRSKDTSIELALRKALWGAGIRYRKNYAKLPGRPDIAITKYKLAIFCDGEFWHGKNWEETKNKINSNREFWHEKIERNMRRDYETDRALYGLGWTVMRFWGAEIAKDLQGCVSDIKDEVFRIQTETFSDRHEQYDEMG